MWDPWAANFSSLDTTMTTSIFKLTHLPAELLCYILFFLTNKNDLRHLCLTSRILLPESRRRLYRHVWFKGMKNLMLWTETILSSDIHAALVFTVTLPSRGGLSGYYERALGKCLAALPHLEKLNISHWMTQKTSNAYLSPKMLEGCSKSLRSFNNDLADVKFNQEAFAPLGFFATHPNIQSIRIAHTTVHDMLPLSYDGEVPLDILPELSILQVEDVDILQAFRLKPIQRLCIGAVALTLKTIKVLIEALEPFCDTLISLCVQVIRLDRRASMANFIEQLATCVPKLRHLSLLGLIGSAIAANLIPGESISFLLTPMRALPNLQTLIIGTSCMMIKLGGWGPPTNFTLYLKTTHAHTPHLIVNEDLSKFFGICKKLEKVTFGCARDFSGAPPKCFMRSRRCGGVVVECQGEDFLDTGYWVVA
ncbi:hypothetical protein P691DRAFT_27351 [Macrolepiota fuliginosa MF-IS2]|uniref:F-box domain-containing protein n=1 Tax=Macrolepiota fuliginosa MF-IS2 TaxID=1400762 RepID=A0A9P5XFE7_9AGAR|nr:hypothetical protein P691DRAFT_27351 [Macrolepiota fuliginosa MF-IS2]